MRQKFLISVMVGIGFSSILLIITFFFLPYPGGPTWESIQNHRRSHCLSPDQDVVLCPNIDFQLLRPDGQRWRLRTNEMGERLTPHSPSSDPCSPQESGQEEIWLIGDSNSMGYLVEEGMTMGDYLSEHTGYPVRNMSSDSLGTPGIFRRVKQGILDHSQKGLCKPKPKFVFWIWSLSDFLDDEKEKNTSPLKRLVYPIHFYLAKQSRIYLWMMGSHSEMNRLPEIAESEIPEPKSFSHPTYSHLKKYRSQYQDLIGTLPIVILGWGMHPSGKPETRDPDLPRMIEFFREEGWPVLDARKELEEGSKRGERIFVPGDGHPDFHAHQIYAKLAAEYIQSGKTQK